MQRALGAKSKLAFIDGSMPIPDLTKVCHDTSSSAKFDRIRVFSLRSAINNLKQGIKSALEYFIKVRSLWDELNFDRPIPNCTCIHPCTFDSIHVAKNYRTLTAQTLTTTEGISSAIVVHVEPSFYRGRPAFTIIDKSFFGYLPKLGQRFGVIVSYKTWTNDKKFYV
ncbi:hypothetical protein MTR_6g072160 [Medicago truncatula]|uniref:Uncharacterized protein n=1 Tax=Medicago truncatula TaxID=3880 RepID=G7KHX6_MEDTR|nr:hypothetical protein MTR_6g072160 [Medicago truncatula]